MSSYIYQSSLNSQPSSNFDTSDSNSSPYLALFNNSNIKSRKNPLFIQRQITKEPLACDIIKQARASLKHPTRPITPLERRRSSLSSGQNSLLDSYNEVQQNSSHLGANFGLPFKSRNINTGIKRNNEVYRKIISRPYRLKPIDPSSLKNLHILQSNENTDHQNNTILDNSNINQNKSDLNDNGNTLIERKEYEGNNCLNKSMEELSINNEEIENKNQDRPLTTSELIVSLIRCPLSDLKPEEKKNLLSIINNVIKNHNFSIPLKSKMNHWKTKPIHAQFIIDCCGNILCNVSSIVIQIGVCKVLFRLSKNDGNDRLFEEYKIIKQLLKIISAINLTKTNNNERLFQQYDLLIYSIATLKNISNSYENQNIIYMMDGTSIFNKIILMLIKLHSDTNKQLNSSLNNRPTQILIQITATIRNLVTNEHARSIILKDHIIKSLFLLLKSYSLFNKYEELVLNISRIFSKLSLYTDFQILLENSTSSIVTLTKLLLAHYNNNPLVVRICFILGNLSCDKTSTIPDIIFDYIPDLVQLLELLVRKTINKKIKSNDNQIEDNNKQENYEINLKEKEEEDVLIKLIRLIANMALNSKVGPIIAEIPEIKCLVDLFKIKNIHDNEELILNIIGAIANISYYNESNNEILDQRIIIAKLLLPLMFYDNVEAVIEASRVFGNITQFQDVCDFAKISKASEMFVILLDHSNRDVVYNICGVLINLINYQYHCDVYLQNEGVEKHLEILELCINMSDFDLACLICKIFYNLCLTDNNWAQKISNSDDILIQLYNLLEVSQEYQYSIPFLNDTTIKDDDAFDKKVIDDNENNHETIDLFQSSHTTEDFLHYMDISTKLMNKLILYIEYAESQQNLLMDYSNPEPDYEVDTIQKMTENFDEATEEDEILYK